MVWGALLYIPQYIALRNPTVRDKRGAGPCQRTENELENEYGDLYFSFGCFELSNKFLCVK